VSARPFRVGDRVRIEGVVTEVDAATVQVRIGLASLWFLLDACELVSPTFEPGDIVTAPGLGPCEVVGLRPSGLYELSNGLAMLATDLVLMCCAADRADR
jgi:hypothetical protein